MFELFKSTYGLISGQRIARFKRDEDGSLIIFSLFLLILMLMISGMAVDLMRTETQRSRLQSTLDRAVLAGASLQQTLDSEDVVRDYFDKAGLGAFLSDVTVSPGVNSKSVTASASADVQSFFMNLMGIETLLAPASGTAEESFSDIEISLVVDISGSMGSTSSASGNKKIVDLANAAKDFVFMVQCNPDDVDPSYTAPCTVPVDEVSVSLVPYMEQVNVGAGLLNEFNVTNEHAYSNCAEFGHLDFFNTEISLTDSLLRSAHMDVYSNSSYTIWPKDTYRGCRLDAESEIVPLSNDWKVLQTHIDGLTAYGNTSIDVGMKWGTALLDPAFNPAVLNLSGGATPVITPAFADRPSSYTQANIQKIIVLMTDGVNTNEHRLKEEYRSGPSEFWYDSATDMLSVFRVEKNEYFNTTDNNWYPSPSGTDPKQMSYPQVWDTYNVDYYSSFTWLSWPANKAGNETKNANLVLMCAAARDQGIEIYTLGFETTGASTAVMKKCATTHAHHFEVNGNDIDEAFAAIARDIQQLRLTH